MIKYELAKRILSKYVGIGGRCPSAEDVDVFVKQVLQYLLLNGAYGNERKFCFHAQRGCFTLPKELEVPLKIRIDREVGTVWNRWFEYHSGNHIADDECLGNDSVLEEPNLYPTVYDISSCGAFPAVLGHCEEAEDAHVVVKGKDLTGRDIFTTHQGERVVGVYLSICKNKIIKSNVMFGRITEVYKTRTKGYVTLLGLDETECRRDFLADYDPYEETPAYRRIRILSKPCPPICQVSVLGRIRLKDFYADEDIIPFDNIFLLQVAGQTVNKMYNDETEMAIAKDQYVRALIETEGNYKKVNNGQPLELFRPLSGGAITNAPFAGRQLRNIRRRWQWPA